MLTRHDIDFRDCFYFHFHFFASMYISSINMFDHPIMGAMQLLNLYIAAKRVCTISCGQFVLRCTCIQGQTCHPCNNEK